MAKTFILKSRDGKREYAFTGQGCDPEYEKESLEVLNHYFPASTLEKYNNAVLNGLLLEAHEKFNRGNKKSSLGQTKRVQAYMNQKVRAKYGPYVSVVRQKSFIRCNLNSVFKTPQGRLYNSMSLMNLYTTTHALDRFSERIAEISNHPEIVAFDVRFRKSFGIKPTALDFLEALLEHVIEFCPMGNSIYLNVGLGILVCDGLDDLVYIGKTFLTPLMAPKGKWYRTHIPIPVLLHDLKDYAERIDEPVYDAVVRDMAEYKEARVDEKPVCFED